MSTKVNGLPVAINLDAYRGDTWSQEFRLKYDTTPVNLTGIAVASWACQTTDLNGRPLPIPGRPITLITSIQDAINGLISVGSAANLLSAGQYRYDVELTDGGVVTTWISGTLKITDDVTHHAS